MQSAIRLFAEKGFRGATTRELAASLGVTEPVLYQHFATKDDLYAAIIAAKIAEGSERTAELQKLLEGEDDRAILAHIAALILDRYEHDPAFIRLLLFSALERHELGRQFYGTHVKGFYEMIAAYLRRRIRAGAFRAVNATVAARSFMGMVQEHGLTAELFGPQPPRIARARLIDEIVAIFLDGIRVQPLGETK